MEDKIFLFFGILVLIAIASKLLKVAGILLRISEGICGFFDGLIKLVLKPVTGLKKLIAKTTPPTTKKFNIDKLPVVQFLKAHPNLGTPTAMIFFIACGIFILVNIVIGFFTNNFEDIFMMLPFYFFFALISGQVEFSFTALISAGISAMLIGQVYSICMKDYPRKGSLKRWIVALFYCVVTTLASCTLGYYLSNVWTWMAETGISIFEYITNAVTNYEVSFIGIAKLITTGLIFIEMAYVGILLIVVSLKEYVEAFFYGAIGVILLFIGYWGSEALCEAVEGLKGQSTLIFGILVVLCMVGVEFYRLNKDEFLGDKDSVLERRYVHK